MFIGTQTQRRTQLLRTYSTQEEKNPIMELSYTQLYIEEGSVNKDLFLFLYNIYIFILKYGKQKMHPTLWVNFH